MFGMGSIGNFLPLLGSIGSGFSGGGILSLGFSLLSGLLSNIGSPKHPGFNNMGDHPGFNGYSSPHPGFGSLNGGPNVSTFGSMNGYFGSQFSSEGGYSILPQTPSGQYYANGQYSYGNSALTYSPVPSNHYGGRHGGHNLGWMNFGGQLSQYQNSFQSMAPSFSGLAPSYHQGQTCGSYGSAPAPAQQGYSPVMSHYGFGAPQQYNPASTLLGHQSGSVKINYGQPHMHTTCGGPQEDGTSVINHHYDFHVHVQETHQHHNHPTTSPQQPNCEVPTQTPVTSPVACEPETSPTTPTEPQTPAPPTTPPTYGTTTPEYVPVKPTPAPVTTPPVVCEPEPAPTVTAVEVEPTVAPVNNPARIVASAATMAAPRTTWNRLPHVDTNADWPRVSRMVGDRITGGDHSPYSFGGRDIRTNVDGMGAERNGTWHVFQQNESLRLDVQSGYFYETRANGEKINRFNISDIAALERQAGGNYFGGDALVGQYLQQRNLLAPGVQVRGDGVGTRPAYSATLGGPVRSGRRMG